MKFVASVLLLALPERGNRLEAGDGCQPRGGDLGPFMGVDARPPLIIVRNEGEALTGLWGPRLEAPSGSIALKPMACNSTPRTKLGARAGTSVLLLG